MQAATQLRGEFAVVIADERQRAMIAIRDRFGVKPLYYAVVNGEVFFASEIKALLALGVPAAWDLEGATGGMGRSHEKTEFAGISTVPPGCYAIARDGDVRIYPYWDWEIPTAEQMRADTRSEAEVVEEFREALRDAVRQTLVADVEVASYLSGGIDSCAVLGLAQQEMDRPIRAFTLTFENALYDEASIAEAQAKHVGATYHPIPITGREIADVVQGCGLACRNADVQRPRRRQVSAQPRRESRGHQGGVHRRRRRRNAGRLSVLPGRRAEQRPDVECRREVGAASTRCSAPMRRPARC